MRLVINALRKEEGDKAELLRLNYATHAWQEKGIKSVANITHRDLEEFLPIAGAIPVRPAMETYPLAEANRALLELKRGPVRGAKVPEWLPGGVGPRGGGRHPPGRGRTLAKPGSGPILNCRKLELSELLT